MRVITWSRDGRVTGKDKETIAKQTEPTEAEVLGMLREVAAHMQKPESGTNLRAIDGRYAKCSEAELEIMREIQRRTRAQARWVLARDCVAQLDDLAQRIESELGIAMDSVKYTAARLCAYAQCLASHR